MDELCIEAGSTVSFESKLQKSGLYCNKSKHLPDGHYNRSILPTIMMPRSRKTSLTSALLQLTCCVTEQVERERAEGPAVCSDFFKYIRERRQR
eukprot:scaffold32904_cov246-Skeletonema_menzelii.AAC.1